MTINQAKDILLKEQKNAKVISTGRYKDWYVFELNIPGNAIKLGNEELEMDPYWFVNSINGEIEHYIQIYKPEIFDKIVWTDGKLYHHGIKGQKWGVRRYQESDGDWTKIGLERREEREGWGDGRSSKSKSNKTEIKNNTKQKSEIKDNKQNTDKKGLKLTDDQKKLVIAGGAAVGTALAIYGAHKLGEHIANKTSKNPTIDDFTKTGGDFSKLFKKKEAINSNTVDEIDKDLKVVNNGQFGFFGLKGRHTNCPNCSLAYEMRRRGLDVKAAQLDGGRRAGDIEDAMGRKFNFIKSDLLKELENQPEGSRGFLVHKGHINNYEVMSDGIWMMDSQIGRKWNLSKGEKVPGLRTMAWMRTDDMTPNKDALQYITNNDTSQKLRETLNTKNTVNVSALAGLGTYSTLNIKQNIQKSTKNKQKKNKDTETKHKQK